MSKIINNLSYVREIKTNVDFDYFLSSKIPLLNYLLFKNIRFNETAQHVEIKPESQICANNRITNCLPTVFDTYMSVKKKQENDQADFSKP